MATSFKRSHACTATLSAPSPAAGHPRPTPLLETPGHAQASLSQSPVGPLLLSPGSWCTQGSVCAFQDSIFPVLCKFWQLYVGLMVTSSKRPYAVPRSLHPEPLAPQQATADLYLQRRHSNTVLAQFLQGLWVLVHTRFF